VCIEVAEELGLGDFVAFGVSQKVTLCGRKDVFARKRCNSRA
jgi:hypothetical protein